MAEFPALTLWTDAYLSDTRHLSTVEHGAYLLLLMEAWRRPHCDLPDDDQILSRLAGLAPKEWAKVKPVIMEFWTRDGRRKTWSQKRLVKERDAARKRSKSASDNSSKRWNKKKKANAPALPLECQSDATTATAIEEKEEAKASSKKSTPKVERGHRIPDDWEPPANHLKVAEITATWPQGKLETETERFRDHWRSASGANARKIDWTLAYLNWLRSADERLPSYLRQAAPTLFSSRADRQRSPDELAAARQRLAEREGIHIPDTATGAPQ
jgi:uncharacterized protein YdaU (DUF1376 family)